MKKIGLGLCLFVFLMSCENKKMKIDPFATITNMVDSASHKLDTVPQVEVDTVPEPSVEDESFDDFIFAYASDETFQRKRTKFPLSYYDVDTTLRIDKDKWEHDYLFTQHNYYTLLFDHEDELDLVGDTAALSVQVEWLFLDNRMVKRYYFERINGAWTLEAVSLRHIEQNENENFVDFYSRFVADSIYQSRHISMPLEYITIDPDDEFSIVETTLDVNQWYAFRPILPVDKLSNINYGQRNRDDSDTKVLKVNGIGNGYTNIFYFRKRKGAWELYRYEDTSI